MDHPFTAYGKYLLITAAAFMFVACIEARLPAKIKHQKMTAAYPLFGQLLCVILIAFCVLFSFAMSAVDRDSVMSRVLIFSLIGLPTFILSFEIFGKKIDLDDDFVSSSYFGIGIKRSNSMITRVAHDTAWKMFRVYFSDGSTLWISTMMRGSVDLAQKLDEKKNGA